MLVAGLLIWVALLSAPPPADAAPRSKRGAVDAKKDSLTGPRILSIQFEGPRGPSRAEMYVRSRLLLGRPPSRHDIADVIRTLEEVEGVGSLAVELRESSPDEWAVTFLYDDKPLRLERLEVVVEGAPANDPIHRRTRQRVEQKQGLTLADGRRYHPFLLGHDIDAFVRDFQLRGYANVEVAPQVITRDGLVTVRLTLTPGVRYRVDKVKVTGLTFSGREHDRLLDSLASQPGGAFTPERVAADARTLGEAQCWRGFPEVRVSTLIVPSEESPNLVTVRYTVESGRPRSVGRILIEGDLPESVRARLAVQEGGPFCALRVESARETIIDHLSDIGFPLAVVTTAIRQTDSDVVPIRIHIDPRQQVKVERIFIDGNRVTRQWVIDQLMAIAEDDLFSESAIEESVQNLRLSNLFRTVEYKTLPGSTDERVYLYFRVTETEPVFVDAFNQRLTFRNVDLGDWSGELGEVQEGRALQGGGQALTLIAQPAWQGLHWRNDYIHRHLIAEVRMDNRLADFAGARENWFALTGVLGVKGLGNRVAFAPLIVGEWTVTPDSTPIEARTDNPLTTAIGFEARADFNLRDSERIPYFGVDGKAQGHLGTTALGGEYGWTDYRLDLRVHLPIFENLKRQHYVLRLRGAYAHIDAREGEPLTLHQRLYPGIRGYGARSIGQRIEVSGIEQRVGGTSALEAGAEFRIPLPWGRRNGLFLLADAASVGDTSRELLEDVHPSAGLGVTVSLFSERFEGMAHFAWPLMSTIGASYVGAAATANF